MQINALKIGHKAKIVALLKGGHPAYRQKLISLGLIPGTEFSVVRVAPFGDPIEILVRGCALTLRKSEANLLQIKVNTP